MTPRNSTPSLPSRIQTRNQNRIQTKRLLARPSLQMLLPRRVRSGYRFFLFIGRHQPQRNRVLPRSSVSISLAGNAIEDSEFKLRQLDGGEQEFGRREEEGAEGVLLRWSVAFVIALFKQTGTTRNTNRNNTMTRSLAPSQIHLSSPPLKTWTLLIDACGD